MGARRSAVLDALDSFPLPTDAAQNGMTCEL